MSGSQAAQSCRRSRIANSNMLPSAWCELRRHSEVLSVFRSSIPDLPIVGVGTALAGCPPTDPDERFYRIRFLSWVMTNWYCKDSIAYSYALQRQSASLQSGSVSGEMVLLHIPLDWRPSLHPLRLLRVVRGFLRYYVAMRLPVSVYHWLTSLDFPMQPGVSSSEQTRALPVPGKVFPSMYRVLDCAEISPVSHSN